MRLIRLLKNDIAREAAEWVDDDLISETQAERICERYDVDYHRGQSRTVGYTVLLSLGYLFIALSLITLLGANWDDIPRAVRMWGLIAATVGVQVYGLRIHQKGDVDRASLLFVLGNFIYGAAIILIAQTYHLGEHMPDGIFWWALGCLPFAVWLKHPVLMVQALALGLLWFFVEYGQNFYPTLFPVFIAAGVYGLYYGKRNLMVFMLVIFSIGFWVEASLAALWRDGRHLDLHAEHLLVTIAMFIFAYGLSQSMAKLDTVTAKDYAAVLAVWSLRFGLVLLFVLGFDEPWEELLSAKWQHLSSMAVISGLFLCAGLWLAQRAGKLFPLSYIVAVFVISTAAVLGIRDSDYDFVFQVGANITMVVLGVSLILRGIQQGISHYFFLGICVILLTAFARYVDLIGDYLGGSALFLVFAIVLLAAARYWKHHKTLEEAA
ncbi:MAG: DUF2157 domain-containing protein [Pseudomonadales bacterium]